MTTQHSTDRRSFLAYSCATAATAFGFSTLPHRSANGSELFPCRLRDLRRSYREWGGRSKVTFVPNFEVFEKAVRVSRQAACGVNHMREGTLVAKHSGFVISIPPEHLTERSRRKTFVVTCDHARTPDLSKPIVSILSTDGRAISPNRQFLAETDSRGYPKKDIRILEFNAESLAGIDGIPLDVVPHPISRHAPIMIYEPMNVRASLIVDTTSNVLRLDLDSPHPPPLEKFILTYVSEPHKDGELDRDYPLNSGFCTGGQLESGGSGSPAILFVEDSFTLAGLQVAHDHERGAEDYVDGEIRRDGQIVHVNNVIEILKNHEMWK